VPDPDDPEVPKLPRGRGGYLKLNPAHVFRILMIAGLLVMVLIMRKPCGDAIGKFVAQFDAPDAGVSAPQPKYMTEEEFRKQLDRSRDAGTPAPK
jgi:hypothetical protein